MTETTRSDLLVSARGPAGSPSAIAATQAGLSCVMLDRRTIVSTIERYPLQMTFFSTPERIEIGGIPFIASHEKPTRADGLIYYRRVAEHFRLDVRPGEDVVDVAREPDGAFLVEVQPRARRQALSRRQRGLRHRVLRQPEFPAACRARTCRTSPTTSSRAIPTGIAGSS